MLDFGFLVLRRGISVPAIIALLILLLMPCVGAENVQTNGEDNERLAIFSITAKAGMVGDEETTKKYVIETGLRNAVFKAAIEIIGSDSQTSKSTAFIDFINASYHDYINNYSIRSTSKTTGDYSVELSVQIRIGALSLGLFTNQFPFPKPRIMVIISEKHKLQPTPYPNSESAIIQGLVDSGFDVVDQNQSELIRVDNLMRDAVYSSYQNILLDERIKKSNAEILIVGEALSDYSDYAGGLHACRAKLNLKAIQVDSAKILTVYVGESSGKETTELLASSSALANSGKSACQKIMPDLLAKFNPQNPHSVIINVYNIKFDDLVNFEYDLSRNIAGLNAVYRRNYSSQNGELEVIYEGTAQNLSEAFVLKPFTKYTFDVVEFTENRIDLSITGVNETYIQPELGATSEPLIPESQGIDISTPVGQNGLSKDNVTGFSPYPTSQDKQRIGLSIVPFEDPYATGLGEAAANTLGMKLNRLKFFNVLAEADIEAINVVVTNRVNWFNMSPNEFAGSLTQANVDWLILGSFNNVQYDISYNEGEEGKDKYGRKYYIVKPYWVKDGAMEISIKVINLKTYEVILEESHSSWDKQTAATKEALSSDKSMANNMFNAAIVDAYTGILDMCYEYFDVQGYIMCKDPNNKGRGIVNLTSKEGLDIEMSLLVYVAGSPILLPNGKEMVTWKELCKATVKEINDKDGYSVIELSDKWFQWIICEQGENKVVPTFLVKKSPKEENIFEGLFN